MENKELEKVIKNEESTKHLNLLRIGATTFGYGIIGMLFNESAVIAPIAATVGLTLSAYSELEQKNMNLVYPALGFLAGGMLGQIFSSELNQTMQTILTYSGATVGGTLGAYDSYQSCKTNTTPKN